MNKPRVEAEYYRQLLVASPAAGSGPEATRLHAGPLVAPDASTRRRHRLDPGPGHSLAASIEAGCGGGWELLLDDTTLDKPDAPPQGCTFCRQ